MKKRLPIIAVFACAILVMLVLLFMPEKEAIKDTDGDGFSDNIDQCIYKPCKTNNGCPEVPPNKEDRDGDGFFLTNMSGKSDDNDSDPCVPNENCPICDLDKDGLTLQEERVKHSSPNKTDTDNDGISDNLDDCANVYGHPDNNGCKVVIPLNFIADDDFVEWNIEVKEYASSMSLWVEDIEIPVDGLNFFNGKTIGKKLKENGTMRGRTSLVRLVVNLNNPQAVTLTGKAEDLVLFNQP